MAIDYDEALKLATLKDSDTCARYCVDHCSQTREWVISHLWENVMGKVPMPTTEAPVTGSVADRRNFNIGRSAQASREQAPLIDWKELESALRAASQLQIYESLMIQYKPRYPDKAARARIVWRQLMADSPIPLIYEKHLETKRKPDHPDAKPDLTAHKVTMAASRHRILDVTSSTKPRSKKG